MIEKIRIERLRQRDSARKKERYNEGKMIEKNMDRTIEMERQCKKERKKKRRRKKEGERRKAIGNGGG